MDGEAATARGERAGWAQFVLGLNGAITFPPSPLLFSSLPPLFWHHFMHRKDEY